MSTAQVSKSTVLVTGANRGIGLAIAEQLSKEGHRVVLTARKGSDAENEASRIRAKGGQVVALELDLTKPSSIKAALSSLAAQGIEVDALVNNAGVLNRDKLLDLPDETLLGTFAVHITGPLALIRGLVPGMTERGYGRIVNVSSGWGSFAEGLGGPGDYGVTKAALNAMTLRLSRELPSAIKINTMCPGWVRTRMGGDGADLSPEEGADTAVWLATLPADGPTGGFFRNRKPIKW